MASKPAEAPVAPVDAVIDDVFGRQLGMQERQLAADEMAYSFFSSVRDSCGDEMDPETSAELNRLLALSQAEKGETGHTYSGSTGFDIQRIEQSHLSGGTPPCHAC